MSYANLSKNTTQVTAIIINPNGTMTGLDSNYEPVYEPTTIATIKGNLTSLSSAELVARSQLQDNSTKKLIIDDNTLNRTIKYTYEVTIDSIVYKITGSPKHPVLPIGWLTVYLLEK